MFLLAHLGPITGINGFEFQRGVRVLAGTFEGRLDVVSELGVFVHPKIKILVNAHVQDHGSVNQVLC